MQSNCNYHWSFTYTLYQSAFPADLLTGEWLGRGESLRFSSLAFGSALMVYIKPQSGPNHPQQIMTVSELSPVMVIRQLAVQAQYLCFNTQAQFEPSESIEPGNQVTSAIYSSFNPELLAVGDILHSKYRQGLSNRDASCRTERS